MNNTKWQINPSLIIEDHSHQKTLKFGQMPKHSFDISENYLEIKILIEKLKISSPFTESEFHLLAQATQLNTEDLLSDFIHLKIICKHIDSKSRYSRHHYYYNLNGAHDNAQSILSKKTVLLIGTGGIGSTCSLLLTAAGVGKVILADGDLVEESNLSRSILFANNDIGKPKVKTAKEHLLKRNPEVRIETIQMQLTEKTFNTYYLKIKQSDFIILSGDSGSEVHKLAYRISKHLNIPIINAGYIETYGVVGPTTIGQNILRENDLSTDIPFIERPLAASYGPLNSIVSSIAVNECIRSLLNLKIETHNCRLVIDSSNYEIQKDILQ